ncbi:MAG: hypothetical protein ACKO25_10080 [Cyanobium sp.]
MAFPPATSSAALQQPHAAAAAEAASLVDGRALELLAELDGRIERDVAA